MRTFGTFSSARECLPRRPRIVSIAHRLLWVLGMVGCTSTLPLVPQGVHPPALAPKQVAVESEAPPVRISEVPPQPSDKCHWLDGHWRREDRRWKWVEGQWVLSPTDCFYSPASSVWVPLGPETSGHFYTPPAWYHQDGLRLCTSPPRSCTP